MGQRTERKNRRVRARSVTARLQAGQLQIVGEVENLSQSGLFVRSEKLLSVGAKVQLDLVRTGGKRVVSLSGAVADTLNPDRAASLRRKTGMGIRFDPISQADRTDQLEGLLRELAGGTQLPVGRPETAPGATKASVTAPAPVGHESGLQRLRPQVRSLLRPETAPGTTKASVTAPASVGPDSELQQLRSRVRSLLIDLSDLRQSIAERDALIRQQRMELDLLRSAIEERKR